MRQVKVLNKAVSKFNKKYPLIHQGDLLEVANNAEVTQEWVEFVTETRDFLGYGYLGIQNKGYGWVISYQKDQPIDDNLIKRIFRDAVAKRQPFFKDNHTTAFRLFNGEGDGFGGITVDWYNTYVVVSWYNETIYEFKDLLIDSLKEVVPSIKGIYEKVRFKSETLPESSFIWGEEAVEPLIVYENKVAYATYLNEGLMTGIFLDQKEVRQTLAQGMVKNKTLLNMFSYTGAFSVAAVAGGAAKTTSVDLAKRSLEKTQEQFLVNQFDLENQRIVVMDVFNYFKYANRKELSYDVIVLDPPSFARNKKKTFSVAKDYSKLTTEAVEIINPGGILVASTNAANVTFDKFEKMVEKGINATGRKFKQTTTYRLPKDFVVSKYFPEGNYLKVLMYEID